MSKRVVIYTDGAYSSKLKRGGYAAILLDENGTESQVTGKEEPSTNQKMELMAAIAALESLNERHEVTLYSDSAYLVNCFRDRWYVRWEKNGWLNAAGEPVSNKELWERLFKAVRGHKITWEKVKGHATDALNNRCDRLARGAYG